MNNRELQNELIESYLNKSISKDELVDSILNLNNMKRGNQSALSATVNGRTIKPMYRVSEITNRTNNQLWVVFESSNPKNGVVLSSVLTRDEARCAGRKMFNTSTISDIRAQRVKSFRQGN